MPLALNQIRMDGLPLLLRRFGTWWLKEFCSLLPDRVAEALSGRGQPSLVIAADAGHVRLELLKGTGLLSMSDPIDPTNGIAEQIERFLDTNGLRSSDVAVGLRLPAEGVFRRKFVLPAQALCAIEAIVAQDLANKTPFKAEDIYSDHSASDEIVDGKVTVCQWITRCHDVHQALAPLQIGIERIAFISFGPTERDQPPARINLRSATHRAGSWRQKAAWGLCCSAIVLGLLAGGMRFWQQELSIERLDADIAAATFKAQQVRALIDELKVKKNALVQLRLRRSEEPGLIDLWEETTRILPSDSWLTEFRLVEAEKHERQISVFGFSSEAPSLVGIVDGSPLLRDAALTSPIAFDAGEGRDRFALQAKVKAREIVQEAGRK